MIPGVRCSDRARELYITCRQHVILMQDIKWLMTQELDAFHPVVIVTTI